MKVLSLYKYNIEFFQPLISKEINGQIKASIYLALLCFALLQIINRLSKSIKFIKILR
jgi:hypothetical protein